MRLFSLLTLSLLAAVSSVGHASYPQELELRAIKNACGSTTNWESETKCFRTGIQGVINNDDYMNYTKAMCGSTVNWESEAKCYRGMIVVLDDRHLNAIKNACQASTNWESEVKCYRSAFSNI